MQRILEALARAGGVPTGRLHRELLGGDDAREEMEELLGALARSGLVRVKEEEFERDGRTVRYRRAFLTGAARRPGALDAVLVCAAPEVPVRARRSRSGRLQLAVDVAAAAVPAAPRLVEALRAWRRDEARRRQIPAYRIFNDRDLEDLARARPHDEQTLLRVRGMGPKRVSDFGAAILDVVRRAEDP